MMDLADALNLFANEIAPDSGVRFHIDVEEDHLPKPMALLLYHLAREGVRNSLQHAQATDIWVAIRDEDEYTVLAVRDNGVGFDNSKSKVESHHGLGMISDQAYAFGGTFEVWSDPGQGTTVAVRMPIWLFGPT